MARSPRANAGGGTEVALNPGSFASTSVGMTYGSGQGAGWFGPGVPMTPQAPPEVAGRAFDFPSGYNLINQPRAYEAINFGTLRAFADAYDLLRLIIETRKDAMERLRWVIQPRDLKDKMTPQRRNKIKSVTQLFQRPDGEHNWNSWLRMILEDLFVVDAVTLHRRRTRGGKLIALDQIDGATIRRVLDDWGRTPEGLDETAYQQVLKGMPAVNYTQRDLLYRPRNTRVHKVYGYSPVEQLMMTINIGLRRQVFQLNFFTEGNMPAAMVGVPETWTPDQIRVFQEWFDNILSGNLAERSKTRFVPSAVGKTYIPTQETELFGKAEEWLARVTCFAFSLSPQPFLQMMNRATAQTAQSEAAATGLAPIQNWVKDIIDTILTEDLDAGDYEFIWKGDDELDPVRRQAITDANLKVGQITVNEGRVDQGREPYDDPVYDQPMFMTSNGLAPLALMPTTSGDTTVPGDGSDPQTSEDTAASEDNPDEPKSSSSVKTLDKLIGKADPKQLADFLKTLSEGVTT